MHLRHITNENQQTDPEGAHIPIRPYSEFRDSDPDVVLLFAWNHAEEIFEKEADFMIGDKKWITYVPKVEMF